jgi:penicillin G amidase
VYLQRAKGVVAILTEEETGYAHIRGNDVYDAVYGQGYFHAQHRLWKMYTMRDIARGTLSESVGDKGLVFDKFSRTLGIKDMAEANWETLTDHQKKILQAYADGINDFIESLSFGGYFPGINEFVSGNFGFGESSGNLLPPEFYALGIQNSIRPWSPVDSLCISLIMQLSLLWDWSLDLHREILKLESDELSELADQITPFTMENLWTRTSIIDEADWKQQGKWSEKTLSEAYRENLAHLKAAEPKRDRSKIDPSTITNPEPIPGLDDTNQGQKSNGWVISGEHTATGKPMIAGDPHLESGIPNLFIINELIWEDKFLIGGTIPGIPMVHFGRGKNMSWTVTSPNVDGSDLWQETLDESMTHYFVDG